MLLAAGGSTRLGSPKQLLEFNGNRLLFNTVQAASAAKANPLIVVLGSNAQLLMPEIDKENALIVVNKNWTNGMASSINAGLKFLAEKYPAVDGVIFMMCDQPFVTTSLLNELVLTQQQTGKPIVASSYNNVLGAPAIFHKSFFPKLLQLKGDKGARMIIQHHVEEVATVVFLKGDIDIDTTEDYERLLNSQA